MSGARWTRRELAVARVLASQLAERATLAPGGTKWPHLELRKDHPVYALVGFDGENVIVGGRDTTHAKRELAVELVRRAKAIVDG